MSRRRSSRLVPGLCSSLVWSSTVMLAGVSVEIFSITVTEVFTGSGLGGSVGGACCAGRRHGEHVRRKQASVRPPGVMERASRGREDDFKAGIIMWRFRRADSLRVHQSQVLEDSIYVPVLRL